MVAPKATVFIPTYNGATYIDDILRALFDQKVDFEYEVLVIDSGSTDATLDIIKPYLDEYPNLILKQIPNTEYGHGKTRDEAAREANGEIVVYLSHDAVPSHNRWLYEMVRPFEINDKLLGVFGKQIPRSNCIPMLKSEINAVFGGFGPDFGTTLFYKDDFVTSQGVYDAVSFYSDVNSASRKKTLTGAVPYQHVSYAEDQILGRDIIDGGYYKAYAPRASVLHSNDLMLKEYRRRTFDETYGLRKVGIPVAIPSYKTITKLTLRGIIRDAKNILRDREYSAAHKLYWLMANPLFHIEKWRGIRKASLADLEDPSAYNKYSLEASKK